MRIAVTGSRDFVTLVANELPAQAGQVDRVEDAADESDLAFSLGDVATFVGIVADVFALCQLLVGLRGRSKAPTQRLRFKTALGSTEVELSAEITAEELYEQLGALLGR